MKWSWKIFEIGGVGIYIHFTFLLLLAFFGVVYWNESQSVAATVEGVGFIVAIFACVLLHELGHSMAARRYGIPTKDITLYPIGGVAQLQRMPDKPFQEFVVAIAGPAVNVVIAAALFAWLRVTSGFQPMENLGVAQGSFLQRIMIANMILVVFNMLPAFPMDGGRVLRAVLASGMEYTKATQIAAAIGQGMAMVFGFLGLLFNPFLLFIALFVWIGASQEATATMIKHTLGGIPVVQAMLTDFRTLSTTDTLRRAIDLILAGSQEDFPVVDGREVVGVLTRGDMVVALAEKGPDAPVSEVMKTDFKIAHPYEMLDAILARQQGCQCRTMPVSQNGNLVGLITMDNIGEFLMIQSALKGVKVEGVPQEAIPSAMGNP